ncbi:MAG: glutamate racemase [Saprospiraceae bacterium]|nr:glutamate racemase [Saprospiraceae bacterium]
MAYNNNPIGIFDSGIGGLTVANAVTRLLHDENIIYFGDTAHMPYGDKSIALIKSYAVRISKFLIEDQRCKAVVIACNTASAAAYEYLRDELKGQIPVINVIDPMIERVIEDSSIHNVGIIATKTTIASGVYQEKLSRRKPSLKFSALATPLLAPMIEEGFYNNSISKAVLENYLKQPELKNIDALILACTHYPMIKHQIASYYHESVQILDSAEVVARKLKMILAKEGLECEKDHVHQDQFFVSDFTTSFEKTASHFYPKPISLIKTNIWDNNFDQQS